MLLIFICIFLLFNLWMEIRECSRPNASSPPFKSEPVAETFNLTAIGSKYNINTVRISNLRVCSSAAHMKHFIIVNKVVLVERLRVD